MNKNLRLLMLITAVSAPDSFARNALDLKAGQICEGRWIFKEFSECEVPVEAEKILDVPCDTKPEIIPKRSEVEPLSCTHAANGEPEKQFNSYSVNTQDPTILAVAYKPTGSSLRNLIATFGTKESRAPGPGAYRAMIDEFEKAGGPNTEFFEAWSKVCRSSAQASLFPKLDPIQHGNFSVENVSPAVLERRNNIDTYFEANLVSFASIFPCEDKCGEEAAKLFADEPCDPDELTLEASVHRSKACGDVNAAGQHTKDKYRCTIGCRKRLQSRLFVKDFCQTRLVIPALRETPWCGMKPSGSTTTLSFPRNLCHFDAVSTLPGTSVRTYKKLKSPVCGSAAGSALKFSNEFGKERQAIAGEVFGCSTCDELPETERPDVLRKMSCLREILREYKNPTVLKDLVVEDYKLASGKTRCLLEKNKDWLKIDIESELDPESRCAQ